MATALQACIARPGQNGARQEAITPGSTAMSESGVDRGEEDPPGAPVLARAWVPSRTPEQDWFRALAEVRAQRRKA